MSVDTLPLEKTNGKAHHQNGGRPVPALPAYTFKDSGRTVYIRQRVSPYFNDKLEARYVKDHPKPQPPTVRIPIDDQGGFVDEPNHNDEQYQARKAQWSKDFNSFAVEETINYILNVCLDPGEIDQEAVDAHKAYVGNDDNESDELIYLKYICIGSHADGGELLVYMTQRSQPTTEQIQEKVDTFRDDVPR